MRSRADYESAVRAIRFICDVLLEDGHDIEFVARCAVIARNRLKREFRDGLPSEMLEALQVRNLARYGDPSGPTADDQLMRYGNWRAVIDAASRPANLA